MRILSFIKTVIFSSVCIGALGASVVLGYDQKIMDIAESLFDASYNNIPAQQTELTKASSIADFSNLSSNYEITRSVDFMGVKALVANNNLNNQKLAYIDTALGGGISKEDILSSGLESKLKNVLTKVNNPLLKIQDVQVNEIGMFNALDQYVPYAKVALKTVGSQSKNYEGIIGAVNDNNSGGLVVSMNEAGNYNQKITEDFFQNIKINDNIISKTAETTKNTLNTSIKTADDIKNLNLPQTNSISQDSLIKNPLNTTKCICN